MKKQVVTKEAWFGKVQSLAYMWDRTSKNEIWLRFIGYNEFRAAQEELTKMGGLVLSASYDNHCGQTVIKVREPKLK